MPSPEERPRDAEGRAAGLSDEAAERVRRAHHRLRKASQDLEAFTAPPRVRGRWEHTPVPAEVMEAARAELAASYRAVWDLYAELVGWEPPPAGPGEGR